jgi:hypothetical protein
MLCAWPCCAQLIVFAFHDSKTLRETIEEAKAMSMLTTTLFLD